MLGAHPARRKGDDLQKQRKGLRAGALVAAVAGAAAALLVGSSGGGLETVRTLFAAD